MTANNEQLYAKLQQLIKRIEIENPDADEARLHRLIVEDVIEGRDEELKTFLVKQVSDAIKQSEYQ
jgi:hypothetical protein